MEVGNTVLNQFQILAQKALSLAKRIDQLFQANIGISKKGHFSHKKGTGSRPGKISSSSKAASFNPLARKGTKLNFKVTFLRHYFPQKSLTLPKIKPGVIKRGIYL